jgi:hypothetical protein
VPPCQVASSSKQRAFLMWLDSSWHSLPSTAVSVALWSTFGVNELFLPFFFFLYSPWFSCVILYNFKLTLWFIFSSYLIHLFLIAIFLFQIIYKINFFFQFHPLLIFHLLDLILILFIGIYFIFNHFLNWICLLISSLVI